MSLRGQLALSGALRAVFFWLADEAPPEAISRQLGDYPHEAEIVSPRRRFAPPLHSLVMAECIYESVIKDSHVPYWPCCLHAGSDSTNFVHGCISNFPVYSNLNPNFDANPNPNTSLPDNYSSPMRSVHR